MTRTCSLVGLVMLTASLAGAQERFALRIPDGAVTLTGDVEYAKPGGTRLAMDVYRPATKPPGPVPALVLFHRVTGNEQRRSTWPAGWGRAAAARGLIGVVADIRSGTEADDFKLLVSHLTAHAAELGIEGLAVLAGSGNVYNAFPFVEDPRETAIKAAVMLYGASPITEFRLDLPVLYVRAGFDRPGVNKIIADLSALAMAQNAPMTLLNHPAGQHAFDTRDDDDASREMIERALDFVKRATAAPYQAALRAGMPNAAAAGYMQTGKFHEAAEAFKAIVSARPEDALVRLSYGEALLGDKQYAAACGEFDKLKGKRLGPRDLGLPAARACLLKGDPEAAIAWLSSIPARFRPPQLQQDPVFAPLRERADFKALFTER